MGPATPLKVLGYKAVYSSDSSVISVRSMGPQPVRAAGKIYVKGDLIFQSDNGYGIHVIDNSDPAHPVKIGFVRIWGNSDMSIKENYLYANSFYDLLVIDISDWHHVAVVKTMQNAFNAGSGAYAAYIPVPEHNVAYECGYIAQGKVQTGWVKDSIPSYSCMNY